jgi:hypothetical protein
MPWHKSRFYYDHSTGYKRRILHRLDLSILVATALLIVTTVCAMGSLQSASVRHGPELVLGFTDLQEICAVCAIICAIYLAIALFLLSRG